MRKLVHVRPHTRRLKSGTTNVGSHTRNRGGSDRTHIAKLRTYKGIELVGVPTMHGKTDYWIVRLPFGDEQVKTLDEAKFKVRQLVGHRRTYNQAGGGVWGLGKLPPNVLIQFPSKRWGFVGSVDARLGYVREDGSEASPQELKNAAEFGPRLAGLKTRAFATKSEAIMFAESLGFQVSHSGKHGGQ